jgi:fumarate reductase subunit C
MTGETGYTEFRQRLYRPRTPLLWWLRRRSYFVFVVRELSSIFVAWSVVFLLLAVRAVTQGAEEYRQFLDWSARPGVLVWNAVALLFVVFHAVTWFNLAPRAIVVHLRGRRVPAPAVTALHYALWVVVSAVVASVIVS